MAQLWTPRAHQTLASQYLFDTKRCSLWAHPGLGKTSICYRVISLMKMCGSNFFPGLSNLQIQVFKESFLGGSIKKQAGFLLIASTKAEPSKGIQRRKDDLP